MIRRLTPLVALLALACQTIQLESTARTAVDPVVTVHGPLGDELGISTDYGIVFLGRTAQSGRIDVTAWFGDGPAREEGIVEPLGNGLYATESEILLPSVPLNFDPLPAGTEVIVRGRRGDEPWEFEATIARDERVTGLLLRPSDELDDLRDVDLGAGVFLVEPRKPLKLVGLLSGRLELPGARYYTAVGPDDLWRLVVNRRNSDRPRRWVYREDLL
jgi:hypothetical protein